MYSLIFKMFNQTIIKGVFLRFAGDAIKWPTIIPLVGAAHMIMERDALNILQVVEILKVF
ncbi:unnamed protein product [Meloidogyne enterolobii]|uniref:Uncharacterized protein n=1 Tax=Meloidogyne enterolobii TaxID=390850 RepID=A0ACB0YNA6_MELEN